MGAVLVTGASKGIGRATALHLDLLGHTVLAGVRRAVDGAELRAASTGRLVPVVFDVTDAEALERAFGEIAAISPAGLSGVVNNAGLALAGPLEYLPPDELRHQLEVNVVGVVNVTRLALPMIRAASGRVVNVGSIGGRLAAPLMGAYNASKFAVRALTDSLRLELKPWAIDVVLIEPGAIATLIWLSGIAAGTRLRERLGPELEARYGPAMDALKARAETLAATGLPAERVAEVIATALTTVNPKPRYLVGRDAQIVALIERLPDRWRDRIMSGRMVPPAPGAATPATPASPAATEAGGRGEPGQRP
jgi:NAD(P)-dependent dehydrogenase (short-subunit alcohol dehydrogenase family)